MYLMHGADAAWEEKKIGEAYENGQAAEMEELWKNDWRRAAGRGSEGRETDGVREDGEEGCKDPQQAVIEMDSFRRQMIRWRQKKNKIHGRFILPMKDEFGNIAAWVGAVKPFQGHLLCDIAVLRSWC